MNCAHAIINMPRTVASKVHVQLSAHETWRLRCNFELERYISTQSKRNLTMVEEDVVHEGSENEQWQRRTRCIFSDDPLSGGKMGFKTADLGSDITASFFIHKFDEDHGAVFSIEMIDKRLNVSMEGRQWCVHDGDNACFLFTCVEVAVSIIGIGGLVEMQIERQLRASHRAFPQYAYAFNNASVTHDAESITSTDIGTTPQNNFAHVKIVQEPVSGPDPELGRLRLLDTLGTRPLQRKGRRHIILRSKNESTTDVVPVRVGRRLSRILLRCGCASTIVDSDEIVE